MKNSVFFYFLTALVVATLSACGSVPNVGDIFEDGDSAPSNPPPNISSVPNAVPRVLPRSRYGNPKSYVIRGVRYYPIKSSKQFVERGIASWYGTKFHGRKTSNGERYDMYAMTAAHKTLPLPTFLEVTNLKNGRKIIVKVNDRGPFESNRILDLSYTAAHKLGILGKGTGLVEIRAIDPSASARPKPVPVRSASAQPKPINMYLQVGAFADRSNAENLRARLSGDMQAPVKINAAGKPAATLYKVRIGPIQTVEDADRLAENLASLGIGAPKVIID